ncbi:MAG: GyrI-like domain-containing protein, partial [Candidatus Aminicenantes bacterium]|nr:GyrI-like domain-containing protein [Candidatus Aminicenantes bacterium]
QAAFTKLFGAFFKLPGARMAAPRARWLGDLSRPKEEWVGLFALPLPDSVTSLPPEMEGVRIEEWEYGQVAEILHVGAYGDELPTIQKLLAFIKEQGYAIAGPHEEEYLKGPGMVADPSHYWTIIRYQVKK